MNVDVNPNDKSVNLLTSNKYHESSNTAYIWRTIVHGCEAYLNRKNFLLPPKSIHVPKMHLLQNVNNPNSSCIFLEYLNVSATIELICWEIVIEIEIYSKHIPALKMSSVAFILTELLQNDWRNKILFI